MTTVLDSLVLEFGLDHSQFTRGQKEVLADLRVLEEESTKSAGRAERHAKNLTDMFASFRREAIGALGVFLGGRGISEFTSYITNLDANVGRLAQTMDLSTKDLVAWQGAAKATGGSGEGITATLGGMTNAMNTFMLTGQGNITGLLRPLGISITNANGGLKTATELLEDLAEASQHMDPARFAAFFSMLPGANQESLNLIINGREELKRIVDAQRALNNTTPDSIRLAKQYQEATAHLDTALTSFGRNLAVLVLPALTAVIGKMGELLHAWNVEAGSPEDKKQDSTFRAKIVSKFGSPRGVMDWLADHSPIPGDREYTRALADKWYGPEGQDEKDAAKAKITATVQSQKAVGQSTSWDNFLQGLSYLETSHRNEGNATSSAQGYFQFLRGTAKRATDAGLPDPRYGSYDEQADAAKRYIQRFYPKAAEAIERGDYQGAERMLNGEWPSLPGGSQQQNPSRYAHYRQTLNGSGNTSSTSTSSKTVHVGEVNVYTQATDAHGIGRDMKPVLEQGQTTSQFNTGPE